MTDTHENNIHYIPENNNVVHTTEIASNNNNNNIPTASVIPMTNQYQKGPTIAATYPQISYNSMNLNPGTQSVLINQTSNGTPKMIYTWRLSRSIKIFSMIDIFFCFLYSLYLWPFLFVILFPLCGYYGSKDYDKFKLRIYGVYILLIIVARATRMIYYPEDVYGVVIATVGILVEVWIFKILCKLLKEINLLPAIELSQIKDSNWTPVRTELVWF